MSVSLCQGEWRAAIASDDVWICSEIEEALHPARIKAPRGGMQRSNTFIIGSVDVSAGRHQTPQALLDFIAEGHVSRPFVAAIAGEDECGVTVYSACIDGCPA